MDPLAMILAALAAGAAKAAQETAGTAIKDAYNGLKALVQQRLAGKPLAAAAVEHHAAEPAAAEAVLRPALQASGAADDAALVQAAKQLLQLTDPGGRRYSVEVHGDVHGQVQGDHAQVTMNFGPLPSKS